MWRRKEHEALDGSFEQIDLHSSYGMVRVDNQFIQAVLKDEDLYKGTQIDDKIAAGKVCIA
jgi:hypothetical protein